MTPADFNNWWTVFNVIGAPLAVLFAVHRGWLVTRREISLLQSAYDDLSDRYDRLEDQMADEQQRVRVELEATRNQLIELLAREQGGMA